MVDEGNEKYLRCSITCSIVYFQVTLVNNLEAYGINIEEFSRECQKGVAASATINQINGMKGSQLQIQGNQVNFLEKILTGNQITFDNNMHCDSFRFLHLPQIETEKLRRKLIFWNCSSRKVWVW